MSEKLKLPTLLVIADNPSIRHWIRRHLEDQFYVVEAPNRWTAIDSAQSTGLDFIILDSHFEECDPLELSRYLRSINPAIPILLITGRLKKSFRDEARASGITDFLNDQLAIEELEMRISAGQKTANARKKTSALSSRIKPIQRPLTDEFFKNKILLNEKALRLLSDMKKEKETISLLLLRMDHFHQLQASEGPIAIDEILAMLYDRISRRIRPGDLLIPSSNGFFILLLPHTAIAEAGKIAEQLRRTVQREAFDLDKKEIHLTVSIAVSPLNADEGQYKRIVAQASQALAQSQATTNLIISINKETS
jgi:diguanylate cyclase (GGDEF)-like protein